MNTFFHSRQRIAALLVALAATTASAAPGAHGPNGEHLDAPAAGTAGMAVPRFESRSEAFELVGRLQGGELSIFVSRYESNEPVLGARLEVELGTLKAPAPFHADQGDYAVSDQALLAVLSQPGEHALVITLQAGDEADLLDGLLHVGSGGAAGAARDTAHADGHVAATLPRALLVIAAFAGLALMGLLWRRAGRARTSREAM